MKKLTYTRREPYLELLAGETKRRQRGTIQLTAVYVGTLEQASGRWLRNPSDRFSNR